MGGSLRPLPTALEVARTNVGVGWVTGSAAEFLSRRAVLIAPTIRIALAG